MTDTAFTELAASLAKRSAAMMEGLPLDVAAATAGNLIVGTVLQMPPDERLRFLERWVECVIRGIVEGAEA